jgi:hypothetical protein
MSHIVNKTTFLVSLSGIFAPGVIPADCATIAGGASLRATMKIYQAEGRLLFD